MKKVTIQFSVLPALVSQVGHDSRLELGRVIKTELSGSEPPKSRLCNLELSAMSDDYQCRL